MKENGPKISVITVCRNEGKSLLGTINSILNQTYSNLEYILIDGDSNDDETIKILNEYKDKIDVFVSEKDNGIYDAMNKGILNSSGTHILFINAGDKLANNTILSTIAEKINNSTTELFFARVIWNDVSKNRSSSNELVLEYESQLYHKNFPHPGTIYSRSCFERYGFFDLKYKILADYEWNLRALIKNHASYRILNEICSEFYTGGVSTSQKSIDLRNSEMENIRKLYFDEIPNYIDSGKINFIGRIFKNIKEKKLNKKNK